MLLYRIACNLISAGIIWYHGQKRYFEVGFVNACWLHIKPRDLVLARNLAASGCLISQLSVMGTVYGFLFFRVILIHGLVFKAQCNYTKILYSNIRFGNCSISF